MNRVFQRRLRVIWVMLALAILVSALVVVKSSRPDEAGDLASEPVINDFPQEIGFSSLALRKKLELPFQLNFPEVDLAKLLKWIESQLNMEFRIQVAPTALDGITVHASNRPLVETLSQVLSQRNMGLSLQRDAVAIIACNQTARTTLQGNQRTVRFQMETQIECGVDEQVDLYCGDKGQYRLQLLAQERVDVGDDANKIALLTSLYVNRELKAFAEVDGAPEEWLEVPFPNVQGVELSLKFSPKAESALVLDVKFIYTGFEHV